MKWLYKMEYKHGSKAPANLPFLLVAGQLMVWLIVMLLYAPLLGQLQLTRAAFFGGQLWRLVSFVFVPALQTNPFWFALSLYFIWMICSSLERSWGSFLFDAYLIIGILGAWAACLATGYGSNAALLTSFSFAFAYRFPDVQFLLFFVLPVKAKWLGIFSGVLYALQVVLCIVTLQFAQAFALLIGIANFFLFFGADLWGDTTRFLRRRKQRNQWRR